MQQIPKVDHRARTKALRADIRLPYSRMVPGGRQRAMDVRIVLFAILRYPVSVRSPMAALGGLVLAANRAVAVAEPALERQRAEALLSTAAAFRARDRVGHFTPLPLQSQHLIHFRGLLPGLPLP